MSLTLEGVRILDLSSFLPGPFATQILADLGATVLKVERPPHGDLMREILPPVFVAQNRGKCSIGLDLRTDNDRELLLDLAADADVLVDGFRPGALERLGVGFGAVAARSSKLLYVSLTGWGSTGPLAHDSGHNSNYLARTGYIALSGEAGGPPSDATAVPVADMAAGMYAVIGILAAMLAPRTEARHLEVPLFAAALAWSAPRLAEFVEKGASHRDEILVRPANGVFPTGDGKYITIAAVEDHFFRPFCAVIGHPELAERSDLATYADRFARVDEIQDLITKALATNGRDVWVDRLIAAGIPAAPVLEPHEVPSDPQVRHLGILHQQPAWHTDQPIFGLPTRRLTDSPAFDAHGAAVREGGWNVICDGGHN